MPQERPGAPAQHQRRAPGLHPRLGAGAAALRPERSAPPVPGSSEMCRSTSSSDTNVASRRRPPCGAGWLMATPAPRGRKEGRAYEAANLPPPRGLSCTNEARRSLMSDQPCSQSASLPLANLFRPLSCSLLPRGGRVLCVTAQQVGAGPGQLPGLREAAARGPDLAVRVSPLGSFLTWAGSERLLSKLPGKNPRQPRRSPPRLVPGLTKNTNYAGEKSQTSERGGGTGARPLKGRRPQLLEPNGAFSSA